ncbi:DUF5011 domain-containing protein, partial [Verrucomicrobia bacterium]|nr:DUF5011 domain-containing protein [Verrucomicrobiota bacterium]
MKSTIIAFSRLWINGFVYILLLALNDVNAANFSIQDQEVPGDALTVTVPIKVSDFSDVGAMQFTLSWDPAVLSFKSLGDFDHSTLPTELFSFGETHFSLNAVSNGNLLCLYEQPLAADVILDGNATIFSITFDVVGGDGSSSHVQFSDEPTLRKLASFFAQSPEFISQNGTIQIGTAVTDKVAPVITLTGDASVTHELGTTYTDEGATVDGGETITTTGTVDVNTAGTYILTYTATDAAGNSATAVTRTVDVLVMEVI